MNKDLAALFELNNLVENDIYDALHKDILEAILSEICEYMKTNDNALVSMKRIYFRSSDNIQATRQIVQNICHLSLSDDDLSVLTDYVMAFFKKKPQRKPISNALRHELWIKQNKKCCICGKEISEDECHVDHIVPWDYVGDELENNYQVLCQSCNLHKSNHISLALHSIIFHKI